MRDHDPRPSTKRPGADTYAHVRWWAPVLTVSVAALVGGIATLVAGEPVAVSVALFAVTVVAGTGGTRARDEYRRGWRQGYESAIRTMLEHQAGRTPGVEVRAMVYGDPTPEPWEKHTSIARPRSMK